MNLLIINPILYFPVLVKGIQAAFCFTSSCSKMITNVPCNFTLYLETRQLGGKRQAYKKKEEEREIKLKEGK